MNDGGLATWQWAMPAAAAAAILAMYFLKTRRHPVLVPSTYLWRRTIEDHRVNALWQRLRKSLLLLLQLLAVAAAAIALLRPSWEGSILRGGRYIFLIDNSASMATTDVQPTRLDEAKRRALSLIDKMGSGDAAMVVSFAAGARIEQTFTENRERLRRAVRDIQPTDESTSLDEALRLCTAQAQSDQTSASDESQTPNTEPRTAQVFIFSDGNFPDVDDVAAARLDPVFVPIGTSSVENVGVVRLAVRRNLDAPRKAQALARVRNFGSAVKLVDAVLYVEDKTVDAQRLTLPPGSMSTTSQQDVVFTLDNAADGVWELRLTTDDALPVDDRAWAVLAPPTRGKVLVVTRGDRYLRSALATDEAKHWCDTTFQTPNYLTTAEYRSVAESGKFDLIVFDRCKPETMPASHTLFFGALPPGSAWRSEVKLDVPQVFDTAQAHPLMQNVSLGDVLVAEASPPVGPSGSQTLVDSQRGALAVAAPRDGFEDVVFGFALVGDDGVPQTNWPLVDGAGFEQFMLNAVQYFGRGRHGENAENQRPGEPVRVAIEGTAGDEVTVVGPDGIRTPLRPASHGELTFYGANRVGSYEVWQGDRRGKRFAVNLFDPRESNPAVAEKPRLRIGDEEIKAQASWEVARWEGWKPLLFAALVILLIEWYIYGSRGSI